MADNLLHYEAQVLQRTEGVDNNGNTQLKVGETKTISKDQWENGGIKIGRNPRRSTVNAEQPCISIKDEGGKNIPNLNRFALQVTPTYREGKSPGLNVFNPTNEPIRILTQIGEITIEPNDRRFINIIDHGDSFIYSAKGSDVKVKIEMKALSPNVKISAFREGQSPTENQDGKTTHERSIKNGCLGHLLDGQPKNPWTLLNENGFPQNTPVIYGGEPNAPKQKEKFAVAITKKSEDGKNYPLMEQDNLVYPPEIVQFKIVNGKLEFTAVDKPLIPISHKFGLGADKISTPFMKGQIDSNSSTEFTYEENGKKLRFKVKTGNINGNPPEISIDVKSS